MYIRLNVKTLVCLYNEYVYMYPFVSPIRLFDSDIKYVKLLWPNVKNIY